MFILPLVLATTLFSTLPDVECFSSAPSSRTLRTELRRRAYARAALRNHHHSFGFTRILTSDRSNPLYVATEELADLEEELYGPLSSDPDLEDNHESSESPIESISNNRQEYQMNLGRALDVIRQDYPDLLLKAPDYSLYHEDIEVIDPAGMTLHGLSNYKKSFQFVHSIVKFFYSTEHSGLNFRLFYDFARDSIRVSWHATLAPKQLYGGIDNKLHVDGVSVYKIDRKSGLVKSHTIENLLINDSPVEAPQGIFHALRHEVVSPLGVPVGPTLGLVGETSQQFTKNNPLTNDDGISNIMAMASNLSSSSGEENSDQEFERKNASRVKFGLKPITREAFNEIENTVRAQADAVLQNYRTPAELRAKKQEKDYGFFGKLFGESLPDTCITNDDCERPNVCCDLIVKKICCSSGATISTGLSHNEQMAVVRVPILNKEEEGPPLKDLY